ncbi:MAG TPA: class F sortase [Natronosporangium sp.]
MGRPKRRSRRSRRRPPAAPPRTQPRTPSRPSPQRPATGRHRRGSSLRFAGFLLVAALAAAGTGLLVAGVTVQPPRPPQPAADAAPPDLGTPPAAAAPAGTRLAMARSVPVRIKIPAIGVDAKVIPLGVEADGEVEVPPLPRAMDAGWYKYGPTPGEPGNAVIIGHVDSRKLGPAVFFKLGKVRPGDVIDLLREDGSRARFRVDGVETFPKDRFPAALIYGPSQSAGLRVVTCGGRFDKKAESYRDNVVVFATLVAGEPDAGARSNT